jgi:hypothetical protein
MKKKGFFHYANFFVSFFVTDFLIILNCFFYFLFLIATAPKGFFLPAKKIKEGKMKKIKKMIFFQFLHD